ncbi:high mobility group protein B1-like [Ruditapes philippinarum]|uniref:high mobility group protein B1-like n=1 Tax=Ruditapes philippinarum TaxID=129788 RepID=UPI00295ADE6F|nr:high mobility group protein B1-like [Ruditapes philippinarum]
MPKAKTDKPKGRMSSYAYFVQCCREEHKKKHPGENVVFAEFTKKCASKWKEMTPKEKKRFEEMAEKDKARYEKEMSTYVPPAGGPVKGKKRTKDPNAPKRALSAFFVFCNEERPKVRAIHPGYTVGDVAKELGKRWEAVSDRSKFEKLAAEDKKRYEAEMEVYRSGGASPKKAAGRSPQKKQKVQESEEEEDSDEEEEEDEDDDE